MYDVQSALELCSKLKKNAANFRSFFGRFLLFGSDNFLNRILYHSHLIRRCWHFVRCTRNIFPYGSTLLTNENTFWKPPRLSNNLFLLQISAKARTFFGLSLDVLTMFKLFRRLLCCLYVLCLHFCADQNQQTSIDREQFSKCCSFFFFASIRRILVGLYCFVFVNMVLCCFASLFVLTFVCCMFMYKLKF